MQAWLSTSIYVSNAQFGLVMIGTRHAVHSQISQHNVGVSLCQSSRLCNLKLKTRLCKRRRECKCDTLLLLVVV